MSFFHLAGSNNVRPTVILGNQEGELSSDVNFTRNTKGSRWDSGGDNELIGVDQPRYNYNPATGLYEGMTIMGQWTNEIKDPRDMTTGNWGISNNVSVARDAIGVDGNSNTANTLADSTSDPANLQQVITISDNSNSHTQIVYVKKESDETSFPAIRFKLEGGTTQLQHRVYINKNTGASSADETDGSHTVVDKGDFWEVSITISNNSSGNTSARIFLFPALATTLGTQDNSATGSTVFDVAGLFLNRSTPPPTPVYGETAGQSYTQDPDIATVTDLDAINFNPSEGTFVVEVNKPSLGNSFPYFLTLTDGTLDNWIGVFLDEDDREVGLVYEHGGTQDINTGGTELLNLGQKNKIAVSFDQNGATLAVNGVISTDSAVTGIPSISQINIGRRLSDRYIDAFYSNLPYYPRRLSNAQLQQLTS